MEKTAVLREQLRNTNLQLNDIYDTQKKLITDYIKEKGKLFVEPLNMDEDGNYILPDHFSSVEDLDYFPVMAETTNNCGDDVMWWIKVVGIQYFEEFDDILVYYCDEDDDTIILPCDLDCIDQTSYRNIINMIVNFDEEN